MTMQVQPCFVCGQARPCEMHHPIPRRAGGVDAGTVPLCRSCHDAIDRMPFDRWDPSEALGGLMRVWERLEVPGRLVLLKMFAIVCDVSHGAHPPVQVAKKRTKRPKSEASEAMIDAIINGAP